MARGKANGEKKPNMMGMVRAALEEVGGDPKPLELQAHIKSRFNTEIPTNIISNYKSQIKRKGGGGGRGRRGGRGGIQMGDLETVRGLVNRLGADQVRRLVAVFA
jgi:hypothetical protein